VSVVRLGGLDATFLALENARNRLHVMAIIVLDGSTVPEGFSADRFVATLAERLPRIAPMRRRVVDVPFGLGRPMWQDGGAPQLAHHLRRVRLDPPGDAAALADFAASIADVPLDRSRPLWELHVVEGLADEHIAVVAKLHHSLMDGAAGMEFMGALFTLEPDGESALPPLPTTTATNAWRDRAARMSETALALVRVPLAAAHAAGDTAAGVLRLARPRDESARSAAPFAAPRTPFDGAATDHRAIALTSVPRVDVEAVRAATGATFNDVVLAALGGALRAWLETHEGVPDRPLVAAMPVSVHEAFGPQAANALAVGLVALGTHLDDPAARLAEVVSGASAAKRSVSELGSGTLMEWLDVIWSPLVSAAGALFSNLRLADRLPPFCNLLVSNVAGPPVPLYLAGARLVSLHPLGPVYDGLGLNVTVISREHEVDVGLVAWREHTPDLGVLARGIGDAVRELRDATCP